jgi:hypothetical protein
MYMTRDEITALVSDTKISEELARFEQNWVGFRSAFETMAPSCRDFIVVVAHESEGKLYPIGIQVEKIDGDEIIGHCFENRLQRKIGRVVRVSVEQVIDFRYTRSYLLQEGGLYRLLELQLSAPSRRYIDECANFFLQVPNECNFQDFVLLRKVEEAKNNQELSEICTDPGFDPVRKRKLPGYNLKKKVTNISIIEYLTTHGFQEKAIELLKRNSLDKSSLKDLLRIAIEWRCNAVFFDLLNRDGELWNSKWGLENCLHVAVKSDNLKVAKCLIELGLSVDEPNMLGETPFAIARSKEMAVMLLSNGADAFKQIWDDGTTAAEYLYMESYSDCPDVANLAQSFCSIAFLEAFHADSDAPTEDDKSPSEMAVVVGKGATLGFLLEAAETDFGAVLPVRVLSLKND